MLAVAVKTVRSESTTLLVRDALCPESRSSSLRLLLLGLELRVASSSTMSHGEASYNRLSGRGGVVASESGGVGGWVDDTMSDESGHARSQPYTRSTDCEEAEGEVMVAE